MKIYETTKDGDILYYYGEDFDRRQGDTVVVVGDIFKVKEGTNRCVNILWTNTALESSKKHTKMNRCALRYLEHKKRRE